MASWRDKMRAATFRGVSFFVENVDGNGGRRTVTHEYPQRNNAFVEDLGRKARGFSVECYVIGDEYLTARDALLSALESDDGPGELVHPFLGTKRVAVSGYRYRESNNEGGMCRFSIDFVETDAKAIQPTAVENPATKLNASAAVARTAAATEFKRNYTPGTLLQSLSDSLLSASQSISELAGGSLIDAQDVAGLQQRVATLQANVSSLVSSPDSIVETLGGLFDALGSMALSALQAIYAFNPGVRPPATTTNRVQEQRNFDALQLLIQRHAAITAANVATSRTFDSYEAAVAERNAIADMLDEQAESATDDFYPAVMQLRADLVKAVPGETGDLPHLASFTPIVSLPSLVVAHRLYGSVDAEQDILTRNKVKNPVFVPGGQALEILSG